MEGCQSKVSFIESYCLCLGMLGNVSEVVCEALGNIRHSIDSMFCDSCLLQADETFCDLRLHKQDLKDRS